MSELMRIALGADDSTRTVDAVEEFLSRAGHHVTRYGKAAGEVKEGFFIPHRNETGYWWQGESARLASLSTAMAFASRQPGVEMPAGWANYAQSQLDWTLGRNPYGISMLYGFGRRNPPTVASSAGDMFKGGISNGITGAVGSDTGEGIAFGPGPDAEQWRWVEQWLPHTTWMLLAVLLLSGLAVMIALMRAGIRVFWVPIESAVPTVRFLEMLPIVGLLFLCVALTIQAGPVSRFMQATAESLHAPQTYMKDVLSAPRVPRRQEGGS